jgi:7-cyano-7-deazaguanine synthase
VPARNSVFLVHALAWAETIGAAEIHIGINAIDSSGYPDCTPRFVDAFERLAEVATRRGVEGDPVRVHAPLLHLGKHEIVQLGVELGVDHADTVSCYDPSVGDEGPLACGSCESCRLRREGFLRAGVPDPTRYR